MKYKVNLKKCKILGKGYEGIVYLTPEFFALKVFKKKKNAKHEFDILSKIEGSKFFPKVIYYKNKTILREFVEGEPLPSYIKRRGLTEKLAKNIIDMVEEFKRLGFTKIDIMLKHIFVDDQENIMVIDPRKNYTTNYPYPGRIVRALKNFNLFDDFLKILSNYKPQLISFWTKKD